MRLAATVPTITPTRIAARKRRFDRMKMPAAIPDAGQNTATSEGVASSASPRWAARKYTTATALPAASVDRHPFAPVTEDSRDRTVPWVEPAAFNAPPNIRISTHESCTSSLGQSPGQSGDVCIRHDNKGAPLNSGKVA